MQDDGDSEGDADDSMTRPIIKRTRPVLRPESKADRNEMGRLSGTIKISPPQLDQTVVSTTIGRNTSEGAPGVGTIPVGFLPRRGPIKIEAGKQGGSSGSALPANGPSTHAKPGLSDPEASIKPPETVVARPVRPANKMEIVRGGGTETFIHDDPDFAVGASPSRPDKPSATTRTIVVMPRNQEAAVTGWLVIVAGPGRGRSFELGYAKSTVGRETSNTVSLNFGDDAISRKKAMMISYDNISRKFYLSDISEINNVYHNNEILLKTIELKARDQIKLGATTLEFVPFCGPGHDWTDTE